MNAKLFQQAIVKFLGGLLLVGLLLFLRIRALPSSLCPLIPALPRAVSFR